MTAGRNVGAKTATPGKTFMRQTVITEKFGENQRCVYKTSAAPNNMLVITRATMPAVNHLERMAILKNEASPTPCSAPPVTGERFSAGGAWSPRGSST